ncbi:chemotaxis protein CheB [Methylocystis sp. JAN1]|uniref:chemotaxis protein CheB n=1 Tax=Methylocystis sp. JAN1 TaxID=3397211 RepID=UPI003FA1E59C
MDNRDILAIGTSAGGFEALRYLTSQFNEDFGASVLITIHLPSDFPSQLDRLLSRAGRLPAAFASNNQEFAKGRIYIAPPDYHLLVVDHRLVLGAGARENHARPAIDPMLRSLAACCGERAVGVILTGTLSDGAAGLWALKECGGLTVVQDPAGAAFPDMPQAALLRSSPDHIAPLSEIPALLQRLIQQPRGERKEVPERFKLEVEIAKGGLVAMADMDHIGRRSIFSCPDCGGAMWEITNGDLVRYRCHVGHAYTAETMDATINHEFQDAMAITLRTLKERLALARQLEMQATKKGWSDEAKSWGRKIEQLEQEMAVIAAAIRRAHEIAARYAES